jgi:spore maturation protein B
MSDQVLELLNGFSQWSIVATIFAIIVWAAVRRVPMYESFITGAKEGFGIAVMIIPYLVAMLLVVKVFMASGIFADIKSGATVALNSVGLGEHADTLDLLPLAFVRPLTASGSKAILLDIFDRHGADSFLGNTASIMMGSSETTFYILMIYFGSVQIKKIRHTLVACLSADFVGAVMAVILGYLLFGVR